MKTQRILIASTLTLLALAGCNNSQPPVAENSANSEAAAPVSSPEEAAKSSASTGNASLTEMKGYLAEANTAIAANDFAKAKVEFNEFHEKWEKVEDGVKDSSKDAYKQIENGIDDVKNNLVRSATPNKEQSLTAVRSLSKSLDTNASSFN